VSTRVLIVDDQDLVRAGFRMILEQAGIEVTGEAGDGVDAVRLALETTPDLVLMDVRMPRMDGIEATRRIHQRLPAVKVVALTTFDLDEYVYDVIRAGASGFLLKDISPRDLVHSIEVVARGDSMLAPALTRRLLDRYVARPRPGQSPGALASVTERERSVLAVLAKGHSNAEIAAALFLSEATVKTYISRMLAKLGLRDRLQLALLAYESGLAGPETD
jgi:DNA-binding NarL/FixJ family response regulator